MYTFYFPNMSQKNLARALASLKKKEMKISEKLIKCRKKQVWKKAEGKLKALKKLEKKEEKYIKKNFKITKERITLEKKIAKKEDKKARKLAKAIKKWKKGKKQKFPKNKTQTFPTLPQIMPLSKIVVSTESPLSENQK